MISTPILVLPLVLTAAWWDLRTRRIPNELVLVGLILGLSLATVRGGIEGTVDGALGALTGFAILFPFFAVRLVGAGDVKLLAMLGAFLMPAATGMVAIYAFAAGGLLALSVMLHPRRGPIARANLKMFLMGALSRQGIGTVARDLGENTAARIPYALAIAAGYGFHLLETTLR